MKRIREIVFVHGQVKKVEIIYLKPHFEVPLDFEFRFLVLSVFQMFKKTSKMGFKAIPYYCVPTHQLFLKSFSPYFFTLKFGAPTHFQRPSALGHFAQYSHGVNPAPSTAVSKRKRIRFGHNF